MKKILLLLVGVLTFLSANAYTDLYLRGEWTDDSYGATDKCKMTTYDGVNYFINGVSMGQYKQFKIADSNWAEYYGMDSGNIASDTDQELKSGSNRYCWTDNAFSNATVVFNRDTKHVYIFVPSSSRAMYFIGSASTWSFDKASKMTTTDGKVYTLNNVSIAKDETFVISGSDWNPRFGGLSNGNTAVSLGENNVVYRQGEGYNYTASSALSNVNLSFDVTTQKLTITQANHYYSLHSNFTDSSWSDIIFEQVDDNTYQTKVTFPASAGGKFGIRVCSDEACNTQISNGWYSCTSSSKDYTPSEEGTTYSLGTSGSDFEISTYKTLSGEVTFTMTIDATTKKPTSLKISGGSYPDTYSYSLYDGAEEFGATSATDGKVSFTYNLATALTATKQLWIRVTKTSGTDNTTTTTEDYGIGGDAYDGTTKSDVQLVKDQNITLAQYLKGEVTFDVAVADNVPSTVTISGGYLAEVKDYTVYFFSKAGKVKAGESVYAYMYNYSTKKEVEKRGATPMTDTGKYVIDGNQFYKVWSYTVSSDIAPDVVIFTWGGKSEQTKKYKLVSGDYYTDEYLKEAQGEPVTEHNISGLTQVEYRTYAIQSNLNWDDLSRAFTYNSETQTLTYSITFTEDQPSSNFQFGVYDPECEPVNNNKTFVSGDAANTTYTPGDEATTFTSFKLVGNGGSNFMFADGIVGTVTFSMNINDDASIKDLTVSGGEIPEKHDTYKYGLRLENSSEFLVEPQESNSFTYSIATPLTASARVQIVCVTTPADGGDDVTTYYGTAGEYLGKDVTDQTLTKGECIILAYRLAGDINFTVTEGNNGPASVSITGGGLYDTYKIYFYDKSHTDAYLDGNLGVHVWNGSNIYKDAWAQDAEKMTLSGKYIRIDDAYYPVYEYTIYWNMAPAKVQFWNLLNTNSGEDHKWSAVLDFENNKVYTGNNENTKTGNDLCDKETIYKLTTNFGGEQSLDLTSSNSYTQTLNFTGSETNVYVGMTIDGVAYGVADASEYSGTETTYTMTATDNGNITFKSELAGEVKFVFNPENNQLTISGGSVSVQDVVLLGLNGDFSDSSDLKTYKMTRNGSEYTYNFASKLPAGTKFVVKTAEDNFNNVWAAGQVSTGSSIDETSTEAQSGNDNYADGYHVVASRDGSTVTVTITFNGTYSGWATPELYRHKANDDEQQCEGGMTFVANGTYTKTVTDVKGDYYFRVRTIWTGVADKTKLMCLKEVGEVSIPVVSLNNGDKLEAYYQTNGENLIPFVTAEDLTKVVVTFTRNDNGTSYVSFKGEDPANYTTLYINYAEDFLKKGNGAAPCVRLLASTSDDKLYGDFAAEKMDRVFNDNLMIYAFDVANSELANYKAAKFYYYTDDANSNVGDYYVTYSNLNDNDNWTKYIYATHGSNIAIQSYLTYDDLTSRMKGEDAYQNIYLTGSGNTVSGSDLASDNATLSWNPGNKDEQVVLKRDSDSDPCFYFHIDAKDDAQFKMSWINVVDAQTAPVSGDRDWATFNLGIIGVNDEMDLEDIATVSDEKVTFKPNFSIPVLLYNQYNWRISKDNNSDELYTVVDLHDQCQSVTLLLSSPQPKVTVQPSELTTYTYTEDQYSMMNTDNAHFKAVGKYLPDVKITDMSGAQGTATIEANAIDTSRFIREYRLDINGTRVATCSSEDNPSANVITMESMPMTAVSDAVVLSAKYTDKQTKISFHSRHSQSTVTFSDNLDQAFAAPAKAEVNGTLVAETEADADGNITYGLYVPDFKVTVEGNPTAPYYVDFKFNVGDDVEFVVINSDVAKLCQSVSGLRTCSFDSSLQDWSAFIKENSGVDGVGVPLFVHNVVTCSATEAAAKVSDVKVDASAVFPFAYDSNAKVVFGQQQSSAEAPRRVAAPTDRDYTTYVVSNSYETTTSDVKVSIITSGVDNVLSDANNEAPVEYYTISGVRVIGQPTPGIYIRRQGQKAAKVVVR